MDDANLKTWWSRELADHLGIGASTLRKWSLELEKTGYVFLRDEHGRRAYIERDAIALRQLKKALDSGKSYDSATKSITEQYLQSDIEGITLSAKADFSVEEERYEALEAKIDAQAEQIAQILEMNKALFMRWDERENAVKQLTEIMGAQKQLATAGESLQEKRERERDERLTELLREIRETKQLASRSVWRRLFGGSF